MLSAAMIVKNEAHNIRRCLESIKNTVDEIVIVDTGSTDATVEIAKRYTKKIYHEPWRNDFGWHRNHSFSLCTEPWIFVIDADDELFYTNQMTPELFRKLLKDATDNICSIGMEAIDWRESSQRIAARLDTLRIFRNGTVKWVRKIHNRPVCDGESALLKNVAIRHWGYDLDAAGKAAKARRTIGLLEECIAEDPEDYESVFYIAQAHGAFLEDEDGALKWGRRYLDHREKLGIEFNESIYHLVAAICGKKKLEDECQSWITEGLTKQPLDLDLLMDQMQWGIRNDNRTVLVAASQRFIYCYENFDKYRIDHPGRFFFNYNLAAYSSALFYAATGLMENGVVIYRQLKKTISKLPQSLQSEIVQKIQDMLIRAKIIDADKELPLPSIPSPIPQQKLTAHHTIPQNLELPAI